MAVRARVKNDTILGAIVLVWVEVGSGSLSMIGCEGRPRLNECTEKRMESKHSF